MFRLIFCQEFGELNHIALHNAFKRVKANFTEHAEIKGAFYQLRGGIHNFVSGCVKNVKVTIYIDEVLEDPIEVLAGAGDNELVITIDEDANVSYEWTKETWSKKVKDAWNNVQSILQEILGFITSKASSLLSVKGSNLPAIKDY